MATIRRLTGAMLLLQLPAFAAADRMADPMASATYVTRSWRTTEGLPQNTVNAIAQTPDGYLWLGTRGGLARFDGVRFVNYGLADGLKGLHIRALVGDGAGGLWIGTMGGGLSHLHDGVITTQTTEDGLVHNDVMCLARDGADGLWVGTRRGLQRLGRDGFQRVGEAEGVRGMVTAMALTPRDGLWLTMQETGLFHIQDGRCEYVEAAPKSRELFPSCFLVDAEGALWIGMGNYVILRRKDGKWTEFNQSNGLPFSYTFCMAPGPAGEVWVGSHEAGLHVLSDGRVRDVPGTDQAIRSLMVTPDGIVWAGTQTRGLFRLTPRKVNSYPVGDERRRGQVNSLVEEPDGTFWAITYGAGLFHGPLGQLDQVMDGQEAAVGDLMRAGVRVRDGTVYFAGSQRLARKPSGSGALVTSIIPDDPRALCEGPDGLLWMGNREGELKRLVDGVFQTVSNGTFPQIVQGLARGPGASMWVGTQGAGLFLWEAGRVRRWTTADGLPTDILLALHPDAEGTLWIGTAGGGLAWLEKGKPRIHSVNSRQGLSEDVVAQILEDDQGNLWLGGQRGIMRVSKSQLRAAAGSQINTVHPLVLNESDGMISAECTGGYAPAGLRGESGLLYFSTVRGVVAVDPKQWNPVPEPPKVVIEDVQANGRRVRGHSGRLSLAPRARGLEIHYTAFNYAKPEQLHFRHRLRGVNADWQEVEGTRHVRYPNLPPGDYMFEVTAANPDLHWNQTPATLAFTVPPAYWQTWWFRSAAGLLLASVGGGAVHWRNRERRRLELVEMERVRAENQARRQADERFRQVVEASPNGIVLVNQEGRIILINAHAEAIFGYRREELVGQMVERLLPERFREAHSQHRADFHAAPGPRAMGAGRDLFARRKNGTEFPVEIGLSTIQGENGPLILAAIADISARAQSENELAQQRSELAHMARVTMLGELSGSLAHELNQPLTSILSNAQAAQRFLAHQPPDLDELREILKDIVAEDKRAGEIIRRLRLLLKKGEEQHQLLEVNSVVQEVLGLMRSDLVNHRVTVQADLSADLPLVKGDRVQLQQVLLNVLKNGCDAMAGEAPSRRRLVIRTRRDHGGPIQVSVTDSGTGIAPDKLEQMFTPFFTTKPHGMGLGLAVCRTIITAHGGKLWAENNTEPGATFHFTLPAVDTARP